MSQIKKTFRFNKRTVDKILTLANEKNISQTSAIELAMDRYFEDRHEERISLIESIDSLVERHLEEKLTPLKNDLNRVRIAANIIDKHVQMILEFWNHYFVIHEFKALGTTEKLKTNELQEAEELIMKRIAHNRQRKLDSETKRKKAE
ncbi:hypothetical protein MKZ02_22560 [Pseudobacillus sp. FSL P4-0506]|uniref:hypothetical protein n=1 Tax=unclassified Pseudobacillus TaxID=2619284 RepID=UPI0030F6FF42